jgi:non-ribosomal peptide synthetase component F
MACLAKVLGRRLRQNEVTFHSTYMHRDRPGTENLVSCFGNSLAMRCDLSGSPDVRTLVARTMTTVDEAFANAFAPLLTFPELQAGLPFKEPLITPNHLRINFNYVPEGKYQAPSFADLAVEYVPMRSHISTRFDFVVFVRSSGSELIINMVYDADLFEQSTAQDVMNEYVDVLGTLGTRS